MLIVTTTNSVEGREIIEYRGIVAGEAVIGANIFRDLFAAVRDIVGGRSGSYEKVLKAARDASLDDMIAEAMAIGADAIVGVDLDYETAGKGGAMLIAIASGTAVKLR
jgi:uncharacterized protein YbjQ (UPF0145 family)